MAATKVRDRRFPQTEFTIPMADALAALLSQGDIAQGDGWHFHVDGDTLRITRLRAPTEEPVNGPPGGTGPSPPETDGPGRGKRP